MGTPLGAKPGERSVIHGCRWSRRFSQKHPFGRDDEGTLKSDFKKQRLTYGKLATVGTQAT